MAHDIITFLKTGILKIVMLLVTYVLSLFSSMDSHQDAKVLEAFDKQGFRSSEIVTKISKIESNIEQLLVSHDE